MRLLAARSSKSRREVKKTGPKANGVVGTKRKVKSDQPNFQKNEAQKALSKLEIGRKQQARGKNPI
jgi:hypothetical protein